MAAQTLPSPCWSTALLGVPPSSDPAAFSALGLDIGACANCRRNHAVANPSTARNSTKQSETWAVKALIKNGKYFVEPDGDDADFKVLFKQLAALGAGRSVDEDGFSLGPWTPELLADAISQIEANRNGVDLRTVQLWFQDNDKGISSDNIRWLARVFGCDDPEATSAWQATLLASRSRLVAVRRQTSEDNARRGSEAFSATSANSSVSQPVDVSLKGAAGRVGKGPSLPMMTEAFFGRSAVLDFPALVVAGAVVLGFVSYFLGIHSIEYIRIDGVAKEVGFLWAPNWTVLFMVLMPLFFAFTTSLVAFWKGVGRPTVLAVRESGQDGLGWPTRVREATYTYWAVFLICIGFAGLFQWTNNRLRPLLAGHTDHAIDWGSLAIVRPEAISVAQAAGFTGLAYLYMCLCFYLFFAGLILIFTIAHDFGEIDQASKPSNTPVDHDVEQVEHRIMRGIFRCTISGLLIAICMKLQSMYLRSDAENIFQWLAFDFLSIISPRVERSEWAGIGAPTHFTSFVIALATIAVFLYGFIRVGFARRSDRSSWKMVAVMMLLGAGYLLIAAFAGFSVILLATVLVAVYGLFDPGFGTRRRKDAGGGERVS